MKAHEVEKVVFVGPGWHSIALTPLGRWPKLRAVTLRYPTPISSYRPIQFPFVRIPSVFMEMAQVRKAFASLSKLERLAVMNVTLTSSCIARIGYNGLILHRLPVYIT